MDEKRAQTEVGHPSPAVLFFLASFSGAGGEQVLSDVASGLVARGHAVHIAVLRAEGPLRERLPSSVRVIPLRSRRFSAAIWSLGRIMRRTSYTAAISTDTQTHIVLFFARLLAGSRTRLAFRIGVPLSVYFRGLRSVKDKVVARAARIVYPHADALISVSKGVAIDAARVLDISSERFSVIYHPKDVAALDAAVMEEPDHPWLQEKRTLVIVAAGRLREQKGFDMLLRAFALVRDEQVPHLIIFGEGGERQALEELARKLGVEERVSFPGFSQKLYANMARADVFVLPSRWEGLPGTLLEAMTLGAPVIAADCPYGPRELLAPKSNPEARIKEGVEEAPYGMLVAVSDHEALAEALSKLLTNHELRERYATAARERGRNVASEDPLAGYKKALGL